MKVARHFIVLLPPNFTLIFADCQQPLSKHVETLCSFRIGTELDYFHQKLNVQVPSRVFAQELGSL